MSVFFLQKKGELNAVDILELLKGRCHISLQMILEFVFHCKYFELRNVWKSAVNCLGCLQNMSIINIIMVQVLLGLMLKWYYVQMTLQCYVFVEDWMSSNRGGARKKLWKLLFAEFFDYSIFCVQFFVGKEWNKCCGEKKLKFLLWFVHICWIIWLCF